MLENCLLSIANLVKGQLIGNGNVYFQDISIDSRTIKSGNLFIAIKGKNFDGHQFVVEARSKGAVAAIINCNTQFEENANFPLIKVFDTVKALAQLAQWHRLNFPHVKFIAVTGSCGKTTTKEMLRSVLSKIGAVLATEGNLNNEIGVPLTLLRLEHQHQFAVIELGANHSGEIEYLTKLVQPEIAIITNVSPAHLEGFGSLEGIADAKGEIFLGLTENGIGIINDDDCYAQKWKLLLKEKQYSTFAIENKSAYNTAGAIEMDQFGKANFLLSMVTADTQQQIQINLSMIGYHQVYNALAAATVANILQVSLHTIKLALENVTPVPGRLNLIENTKNSIRIIDDTYNSNPGSMATALQLLANYSEIGERWLVIGDMLELGHNEVNYHKKLGQQARQSNIDKIFAFGQNTKFTVEEFGANGQHFQTQDTLIAALLSTSIPPNTTLLVKGSHNTNMKLTVKALLNNVDNYL